MNEDKNYRKILIECALCKTKFEIWISTANFSPELEENIRKNFHLHCPICKVLEELKKKLG